MGEIGISALEQNASEVVARAVGGEVLTVTDRGRPVAVLSGLRGSGIDRLIARGARMPQADIKDFVSPHLPGGLSQTVEAMRGEFRVEIEQRPALDSRQSGQRNRSCYYQYYREFQVL